MALQIDFVAPQTGQTVTDGYVKINRINIKNGSGGNKKGSIKLEFFLTQADSVANKNPVQYKKFDLDIVTALSANQLTEAYVALKLLPEFSGAVDV